MYLHIVADDNDNVGLYPHRLIECSEIEYKRYKTEKVLPQGAEMHDFEWLRDGTSSWEAVLDFTGKETEVFWSAELYGKEGIRSKRILCRGGTGYVTDDHGNTIHAIHG